MSLTNLLPVTYLKTAFDPRHQTRQEIVQELFQYSFHSTFQSSSEIIKNILTHIPSIDIQIEKSAPLWPLNQMSKIDLAVLRLAVYELTIEKKNPPKAIIDEAIELAKEFGGERSGKFVNGVLGTIINSIKK